MDFQRLFHRLPITISLIIVNVVVYALQFLIPDDWVFGYGAFNPLITEYYHQWWRVFTSGFIHDPSNIAHLGMNMLTLYLFGQAIEPLMRRWQYLLLYCLSILGGSAMIWLVADLTDNLNVTTVGASGGVFGFFGAYFAIAKLSQQSTVPILILVAINFGYGFVAGNVSWEAHLGGLITGAIVAFLMARGAGRRRARAVQKQQPAAPQYYAPPQEQGRQNYPSAYDQYRQEQQPPYEQ